MSLASKISRCGLPHLIRRTAPLIREMRLDGGKDEFGKPGSPEAANGRATAASIARLTAKAALFSATSFTQGRFLAQHVMVMLGEAVRFVANRLA